MWSGKETFYENSLKVRQFISVSIMSPGQFGTNEKAFLKILDLVSFHAKRERLMTTVFIIGRRIKVLYIDS